jgi:hypothetical protein
MLTQIVSRQARSGWASSLTVVPKMSGRTMASLWSASWLQPSFCADSSSMHGATRQRLSHCCHSHTLVHSCWCRPHLTQTLLCSHKMATRRPCVRAAAAASTTEPHGVPASRRLAAALVGSAAGLGLLLPGTGMALEAAATMPLQQVGTGHKCQSCCGRPAGYLVSLGFRLGFLGPSMQRCLWPLQHSFRLLHVVQMLCHIAAAAPRTPFLKPQRAVFSCTHPPAGSGCCCSGQSTC